MAGSSIWAPVGEQGPPGEQGPIGPIGPQGPVGEGGPGLETYTAFVNALASEDLAAGNGTTKVGRAITRINSMAELKTRAGRFQNETIFLNSFRDGWSAEAIPSPKGFGMFTWDATSVVADDVGVTIQCTGVTTGRWIRQFAGSVQIDWFGGYLDGTTPDDVPAQLAVNYCGTNVRWYSLLVTGRCLIRTPLVVNRMVNTTLADWYVYATGSGAGFYLTTAIKLFTTTLPYTIHPVVESIIFSNVHFESGSYLIEAYVLSEAFLRIRFQSCSFRIIRAMISNLYTQTLYFEFCNIRNNPVPFIGCKGCYDIKLLSSIYENGSTFLFSVDTDRGSTGVVINNNVIEGIQSSVVVGTGFAGFDYSRNHSEGNFSPELNLWAGTLRNKSITIQSNYVINPLGAFAYHGPSDSVVSIGNYVENLAHSNIGQVTNFVSIGDTCGTLADSSLPTSIGNIKTNGTISPSNTLGAAQPNKFFMGSGIPSGAAGTNGDSYIRTDAAATANNRLYVKVGGAWIN